MFCSSRNGLLRQSARPSAGRLVDEGPGLPPERHRQGRCPAWRAAALSGDAPAPGSSRRRRSVDARRARLSSAASSGERSSVTPRRDRLRRKPAVSASLMRPRRSLTSSTLRTSNHHPGLVGADGWSSSSNAQQAAIKASRTNGISTYGPRDERTAARRLRFSRRAGAWHGCCRWLCSISAWRRAASGTSRAMGRPWRVITTVSPRSTSSSSWGRWVLASDAAIFRMSGLVWSKPDATGAECQPLATAAASRSQCGGSPVAGS